MFFQSPVDGRCAPIAYQLNTCSRVTQTPTDCVLVQLNSEAEDPLRDDVPEELDEYDIKAFKGMNANCLYCTVCIGYLNNK